MRKMILAVLATLGVWASVAPAQAATAEDDLAALIKSYMSNGDDWRTIEKVTQVKWQPLPPVMLRTCLPDGSCFTRSGVASLGGRQAGVMASGNRMGTGDVYIKNTGAPVGEGPMVAALQRAGLSPEVAMCPVRPNDQVHNSKWWRVKSGGNSGLVSLTYACGAQRCEGFGYHPRMSTPQFNPGEARMYTTKCAGAGAAVAAAPAPTAGGAVAAVGGRPAKVAELISKLIPATGAPSTYSWDSLKARVAELSWSGVKVMPDAEDYGFIYVSGLSPIMGRQLQVGSWGMKSVETVYLSEWDGPPPGDTAKAVEALRARGFTVKPVQCGKLETRNRTEYQATTYLVTSAKTKPVHLKVDMRRVNAKEQTRYEFKLDGSLPSTAEPVCR